MATGKANYLLDLAAVRLASLNQTLDPWLYIIVRRSMITNVRKFFGHVFRKVGLMNSRDSEDRVSVVQLPKECHSNNNDRKICHPVAEVDNGNHLGEIFSKPDLMHGNNYGNCLQLPDVTNTGTSGYVCRLHFGSQSKEEDEDEGIYVKISFVSQRSACGDADQRSADDDYMCDVKRTFTSSPRTFPILTRMSTQEDTDTKTTDVVTKEVTSDDEFVMKYPHSETIPDVVHDQAHHSLRKTKSTS